MKYQRSTTSSCKDIGIRKSEFVVETHDSFLCKNQENLDKLRRFNVSLSREYHLRTAMRHTQNIIVIYYTLHASTICNLYYIKLTFQKIYVKLKFLKIF